MLSRAVSLGWLLKRSIGIRLTNVSSGPYDSASVTVVSSWRVCALRVTGSFLAPLCLLFVLGCDEASGWRITTPISDPDYVYSRYKMYENAVDHCPSSGFDQRPRLLVTGFESMKSDPNPSGVVVDAMSKPSFWPGGVSTAQPGLFDTTPDSSDLSSSDSWARIVPRSLVVDGIDFNACLIVLPFAWDLAAGVVVNEIKLFQPDFVLLTGIGSIDELRIESFARNEVQEQLQDGTGVSGAGKVLPFPAGLCMEIPFRWSAPEIATDVKALGKSLACAAGAPCLWGGASGSTGSSICNNVAYAAAVALTGVEICLASPIQDLQPSSCQSAQIRIKLDHPLPATVVGFVHVPFRLKVDTPQNVELLARLLARVAVLVISKGPVSGSCQA